MDNFICPRCGASASGSFCEQCGAPRPQYQPPAAGYTAAKAVRSKTPGYAVALFIVSVVLLLGALGFGAWKLFLNKPTVVAYKGNTPFSTVQPIELPSLFPSVEPTSFPSVQPTEANSPEGTDLLTLFSQAAPASQNGNVIIKWDGYINVQIAGDYTQEEYDLLAAEINYINALGVLPQVTLVEADGNFVFWFVPQSEMASHLEYYEPGSDSYYNYNYDNYRLYNVTVAISTDTAREYRLDSEMYFLMKGLGFLGDTSGFENTDTALGYSDHLTENDLALLYLLYDPGVTPGMTADEAYNSLIN